MVKIKSLFLISCIVYLTSILSPSHAYTPGTIHVSVYDFYSYAPIEGAVVTVQPLHFQGTTDARGHLLLDNIIPHHNYSVTVKADGYAEDRYGTGRTGFVSVESGQTARVSIPMKKASTVTGHVTSGAMPVSGAMVVLIEERLGIEETIAVTLTDTTGNYMLENVPEGDYSIRAVANYFYEVRDRLLLGAKETAVMNFSIYPGMTFICFDMTTTRNYYGNSVTINADNVLLFFNPKYIAVTDKPEGAELLWSSPTSFIPTLPGSYTFAMTVIGFNGVGRQVTQTIEMVNRKPTAHPSVIPGPSELPLLYDNGTVYAMSSGLKGVKPGETIYLRGWGEDFNLPSPEQFDPEAPPFDIYGNKNHSWRQSAFGFFWELIDKDGNNLTHLLFETNSQNTRFTVPADANSGDTFTAFLTVEGDLGLAGEPAGVTVYVAEEIGSENCMTCHATIDRNYQHTRHAETGIGCETCHGPGSLHHGDPERISVTHWPGLCGQCHKQFSQWQKSRHSDPLAFGRAEVPFPLINQCYKCHYTDGFIEASKAPDFDKYTPPFFGTEVPHDTPNVGCDVCHDPHIKTGGNPFGLRTGAANRLCITCHEKKWQNAVYAGNADRIGSGYHFEDYSRYAGDGNPHKMEGGCVTCHFSKGIADTDNNTVRLVGGHTKRMRDVGPDGVWATEDDTLNIQVCQTCHSRLSDFDHRGFQTSTKAKIEQLGEMLVRENHGFMPPFQPGKCSTCHRGSNMPFINETADNVIQHAYLNYSLLLNDKSYGIHNPGYISQLLDDSIAQVAHLKNLRLSTYKATAGIFNVAVKWETQYENNIKGFNIYRASVSDGKYRKINDALIPATGSPVSWQRYNYLDTQLDGKRWYYYRLQDVLMDGTEVFHSPVSSMPQFFEWFFQIIKDTFSIAGTIEGSNTLTPESCCPFHLK